MALQCDSVSGGCRWVVCGDSLKPLYGFPSGSTIGPELAKVTEKLSGHEAAITTADGKAKSPVTAELVILFGDSVKILHLTHS